MTNPDFCFPPLPGPVARDDLAAAGPVEPSSSPDPAPGPTLSPTAASLADAEARRRRLVAAVCAWRSEAHVPTLAFVPGIVVTGRYRMHPPSTRACALPASQ